MRVMLLKDERNGKEEIGRILNFDTEMNVTV